MSIWTERLYKLNVYDKRSDRLVASIDLPKELAEAIGKALLPADTDGIGEYPLDPEGFVSMEPR